MKNLSEEAGCELGDDLGLKKTENLAKTSGFVTNSLCATGK